MKKYLAVFCGICVGAFVGSGCQMKMIESKQDESVTKPTPIYVINYYYIYDVNGKKVRQGNCGERLHLRRVEFEMKNGCLKEEIRSPKKRREVIKGPSKQGVIKEPIAIPPPPKNDLKLKGKKSKI